jgi:predicted transcriptional regulator
MENKNSNQEIDKRFQKVWEQFKDHHQTEGFKLVDIFYIYLPFWQCKQNIVVEKETELDRFSRIILELVNSKVTKHSEICAFLGIDEDSFVTVQFHFLLKNDLIRETQIGIYEITHEGLSFLQNKTKLKNIETVEFEYYITEKMDYLKNDLTQDFFDPNFPIDTQVSAGRKSNFSGYTVMQTHQVQKSETAKEIPHKQKPTFRFVSEQRNNFASFFNKQFKDKNFYDFADSDLEAYRRSICFYGLLFVKEENKEERILEIRQSEKSVKMFSGSELERTLTDKATKYLKENPDFIKI